MIGYGELVAALQRLQNHLNKNGMVTLAGRVTAAQSLLLGPGVARALAVRTAVVQRRRPRILNPVCSNAQTLGRECVESLTQSPSSAAIELCDLLSSHEMEGLLQAHDRIATSTDRTQIVTGGGATTTSTTANNSSIPIQSSPNSTLPNTKLQNSNIVNNNLPKVSVFCFVFNAISFRYVS